MADRIPTRAQLESLETRDEREAVILSAIDQRVADLVRLRRVARRAGDRMNSAGSIIALRTSIRRLVERGAEFGIRVELSRAA